jgi:DNA-binding NarL/FixJ family response regulator
MTAPIRVLIADDQSLVRSGFRMILSTQPDIEVIGEAGDGHDAVALARELTPDVVLMDVRMPDLDGIAATRALLADASIATRVLILTTFDGDSHVYDAVCAGASGFLLKTVSPGQLIEAVRTVAAGDAILDPIVTGRLLAEFVKSPHPADGVPDAFTALSPRELDTARHVAQGLSNAEIAQRMFLSEPTVKTHVTAILAKLGLRDRVQVVVRCYETGLTRPGHGDMP